MWGYRAETGGGPYVLQRSARYKLSILSIEMSTSSQFRRVVAYWQGTEVSRYAGQASSQPSAWVALTSTICWQP